MMERNNGKIIAIVALVVAVIGLSLGFAAFSTNLQIASEATVTPGSSNWKVGFGTSNSAIVTSQTTKTSTNANATGTLNVTQYTLSQNTNATLNFTDKTSVVYELYIVNEGTARAYLDNVTFSTPIVSCTSVPASASSLIDGTASAGTYTTGGNTTPLTAEQCSSLFDVTLTIDQDSYTQTTSGITGKSIDPKNGNTAGYVPVTLTIAYDSTASAVAATLDGDITVTVGTITVGYKSTAN